MEKIIYAAAPVARCIPQVLAEAEAKGLVQRGACSLCGCEVAGQKSTYDRMVQVAARHNLPITMICIPCHPKLGDGDDMIRLRVPMDSDAVKIRTEHDNRRN